MKKLFVFSCLTFILSISAFSQNDIRKVDFKNFTYQPDYCGSEDENDIRNIAVTNGEYSEEKQVGEGDDAYTDRLYFIIRGITFGDLDGDKKDEAVIISVCNTGGTGNFTEAYIYKMKNGKAVRVMVLGGGDRADGGLRRAKVKNGLLIIESNDSETNKGACCPQFINSNTYKFDGKKLSEVGKVQKRPIYPESRINFDKGKSGKTLTVRIPSNEGKRFIIRAAKGQTLTISSNTSSENAGIQLIDDDDDATIIYTDNGLTAKLNKNRDYTFDFNNYTDKDLEFDVTVTITFIDSTPDTSKIESIYTDLAADKCKTIELDEESAGYYRGECAGVGSYKLEVIEGDIRQTINVIETQSGDKWELDFMRNVSIGFSSVGEKAEWRVRKINGKIQPIALIVRYNVDVPTEDGNNRNVSSLVITKFDGEFVCITDVVPPMTIQNEKARELADVAASKPCLQSK